MSTPDVTAADLDRAVKTWADVRAGRAGRFTLPAKAARAVVRADLAAAGLLDNAAEFPAGLYTAVCAVLPRDGRQIDTWGPGDWMDALAVARERLDDLTG
jgi:predicted nucleic acid-binding Zn ribbon protein